jgi:hypothetical protein
VYLGTFISQYTSPDQKSRPHKKDKKKLCIKLFPFRAIRSGTRANQAKNPRLKDGKDSISNPADNIAANTLYNLFKKIA